MTLNGEYVKITEKQSIYDFLCEMGFKADRIAVELNMEIIPREKFKEINVSEADTMEVVTFMGGG